MKKKYGFPTTVRLQRPAEFDRVYAGGQKAGDRHLLVFAAANDREHTRCGVVVSKRHGNSVRRSRLKRMLREAFRLSQHELPAGYDLILIPRHNSGATVDDYRSSLVNVVPRLVRRVEQGVDGSGSPRDGTRGKGGKSPGESTRGKSRPADKSAEARSVDPE